MKRIITLIITLALVLSVMPYSFFVSAEDGKLVDFLPKVYVDSPLPSAQALHALYAEVDGKDYMFTSSSGTPAVLNVYNLDDNKLVATHKLKGTKNIWFHLMNVDGNVYIASKGYFFKYNPRTDELKEYGYIAATENIGDIYVYDHDEEGNIYMGCCGDGEIIKFNIATDDFTYMGKVAPEYDDYIRTISYVNGNIYCGIKADNYVGFYRINVSNPTDREEIKLPENPAYYDVSQIQWVYSSMVVKDKIIIYAKENTVSPMLVYDTTNKKWIDIGFTGSFKGYFVSPERDGKCYFTSKGYMYALNTETWKVENLDWKVETNDNTIASGWVTLENNKEHPNPVFVTLNSQNSQPIYYDVEKKERFTLPQIDLKGAAFIIQSVTSGDYKNGDDALYIGSYLGETSARYNLKSKNFEIYNINQTEGMYAQDGKMYFGTYTKANFHEYDPTKPLKERLKWKGQVKPKQDRPFALTGDGKDKVWLGTIPDYGYLGGALAEYDVNTEEMKVYSNIIENQSIISLAYRDGLIYGTTSVWGGLSSTPDFTKPAKIFVFDTKEGKVIKEFTPKIPGVENPTWIGSIAFDKNGKLWFATGGNLCSINIDTEEIIDNFKFSDYEYSTTTHTWRPYYIRFDSEGRLYVNINGVQVVDVDTLKTQSLVDEVGGIKVHLFDLDKDDNLYFVTTSELWVLPRNKINYDISKDNVWVKKTFSDKTALFVEDSLIYSNGKIKMIDENNQYVAPFIENGRTYVPVRVISEELGAEVTWNGEESTVTAKKDSTEIKIKLGESKIIVNGKDIPIDAPAKIVNDRTFIPLRAVSEAFGKKVFWDDMGVIVISDEDVSFTSDEIKKLNLYSDIYMHPVYKEDVKKQEVIDEYEKLVSSYNGEQIKFKNWNLEEGEVGGTPSGFVKTSDFTDGATAMLSEEKAFKGDKSLNIKDTSTTATAGFSTTLIPYNYKDNYVVIVPLFLSSGRTSIDIGYYDVDGIYLGRDVYNETPGVGVWNIMKYTVKPIYKGAKYLRIRCYTSEYWMSDSYYDEITVIKY